MRTVYKGPSRTGNLPHITAARNLHVKTLIGYDYTCSSQPAITVLKTPAAEESVGNGALKCKLAYTLERGKQLHTAS